MPGQKRDFTEIHRAACVRARTESNLSYAVIAERISTEGLYGVQTPKRVAPSTVEGWCKEHVDPRELEQWLLRVLKARLTLELPDMTLEKALSHISQAAGALEKIQKGERNRAERHPKPKTPEAETSPDDPAPSLTRLSIAAADGRAFAHVDGNGAAPTREVPATSPA